MDLTLDNRSPASRPVAGPAHLERLVVYGNPAKEGIPCVLRTLGDWARVRGVEMHLADDLMPLVQGGESGGATGAEVFPAVRGDQAAPLPNGDGTLLVCLGGDGTLLHATRRFWPFCAPMMAVNLGMVSFNASVEVDELTDVIEEWQAGHAGVSERMVLRVRQVREGEVIREAAVLNDVVLSKQEDSRLIHLTLSQGREQVAGFAADGLIVATPTGSTAYNLSAGGPIVVPTLRVMIVTAICPHTLAARPVVLPSSPSVQMQFVPHQGRRQAVVWLDGQEEWPIEPGDLIQVEAHEESLQLIVPESFNYFSRLRRKLSWSGDISDTRAPRVLP